MSFNGNIICLCLLLFKMSLFGPRASAKSTKLIVFIKVFTELGTFG